MIRRSTNDWGRTFVPAQGYYPPATTPRRDERVVHVCLRVPGDPQYALEAALRSLTTDGGQYAEVDWTNARGRVGEALLEVCKGVRPTLVFMQLQTPGVLTPSYLELARSYAAPDCIIVNWDGDRRYAPAHESRRWFIDLSVACDVSLVTGTADAEEFARLGVKGAGYLQIGVDVQKWRPGPPAMESFDLVWLASNYPHLHEGRLPLARKLTREYPGRFMAYGHGWKPHHDVASRPLLRQEEEAPVYSGAVAAISASIRNDIPRYTSDRLFRILASGCVPLVESFPDTEGLGLVDGENCCLWRDWSELAACMRCLDGPGKVRLPRMRAAARELAMDHSWLQRMTELAAIVEAARERKRCAS